MLLTAPEFTNPKFRPLIGVQRLETNLAYLYHVCRNLMLQNSQLHVAIGQLLSDARVPSMASQPQSNQPTSLTLSHGAVFPTSRIVLHSPQSVVLHSDAASTVSSVQATNRFVPPSTVPTETRPKILSPDEISMMQQQVGELVGRIIFFFLFIFSLIVVR